MGQRSSKEATIVTPSIDGNLDEVKHLIGEHIAASKNGDAAPLKEFVDRKDAAGNSAIHGCVFSGHLEIVSFLAESCGADLTIKNGMGCSPIWIAAGYNHLNCLKYLVEKLSRQADDDVKYILETNDSGDSPFLAAASRGNVDICKYFLKYSTEKGEFTKVRLLRTANKAGDTPLKVAVAGGHDIDLLKLLLEADASISQTESANFIPCIDRKNNLGLSPLIIACERNLPSIVELLIAFGADVNIRDSKGRSALAVAAFCGCEDVVKFLTKSPAVATLLNESDDAGSTPLWLACRTGNLKMVELLIEAGADETIADNEGLTPKDVASKYKKVKVDEYFQNRSTR